MLAPTRAPWADHWAQSFTVARVTVALEVKAESATTNVVNTPPGPFAVTLDEFAGPFDVLLALIAKHKLEVTELALHQVTDEFMIHIRAQGSDWNLDEATSFLVIAATLLDLKAARLLPRGEVEDEEDLALLEARDLLFARLLQYRAFKEVSAIFEECLTTQARLLPRVAGLEPEFAKLLPDVVLSLGLEKFGAIAATTMAPRIVPTVDVDHVHSPVVSVAEQLLIVAAQLKRDGVATFRALVSETTEISVVIACFLSVLELYRQGRVAFDQVAALADLHVRWLLVEDDTGELVVSSEFDEPNEPASVPATEGPVTQ